MGLTELDPSQDPFAREAIEHLVKRYGSPLFIIDAARVRTQYRKLAAALPNVDLHYALKPLPHASVVRPCVTRGHSSISPRTVRWTWCSAAAWPRSAAFTRIPSNATAIFAPRWITASTCSWWTTRMSCANS
jgi:hypothetical protein